MVHIAPEVVAVPGGWMVVGEVDGRVKIAVQGRTQEDALARWERSERAWKDLIDHDGEEEA